MNHLTFPTRPALAPALLAALLAACGGTDMPPMDADIGRAGITAAPVADPVAPLVADDGSLWPTAPQAVPADPGARTRAGRYATPAQADQLAAALADRAMRVQVDGSGAAAVEEAAGRVMARLAQLAPLGDAREAAVFVEGSDLRSAAALVERLAATSTTPTWLVTR